MPKKSAIYRVVDPLENFVLKIGVREVSRLSSQTEADYTPFKQEMRLKWQEKIHGPADIADYIHSKRSDSRRGSPAQIESRREIGELVQSTKEKDEMSLLQSTMLYTYIERDEYISDEGPLLTNSSGAESYLGAALYSNKNLKDNSDEAMFYNSRRQTIVGREANGAKAKTMHVCLATDIDSKAMVDASSSRDTSAYMSEHLLCSFRLFPDGRLEVSPGFSGVLEENAIDGTTSRSLFMENKTVVAGLTKGFKLETFRIRTGKGMEFEYVVENVNEVTTPHEIEELRRRKLEHDVGIAAKSRTTADSWKQDPPEKTYDHSTAIAGEIVSCTGFEGDRFFISYQLSLPDGWKMRTGNLADGYTEAEIGAIGKDFIVTKEDGTKVYGTDILANDGFYDGDDAIGMLRGVTQVALAKQQRQSTGYIFQRQKWRAPHVPYTLDTISRHVLGYGFFLVTVIAVVIGPDYPFWILPAGVILFIYISGSPGGQSQILLTKNIVKASKSNTLQHSNPRSVGNVRSLTSGGLKLKRATGHGSIKEVQIQNHEFVGGHLLEPVAYFGHLIEASFDVKPIAELSARALTPSAECPSLLVQIYSVSSTGRKVLEGYGYAHLSDIAGSKEVEIKTWKPVGDLQSKLTDYFVGGALRLKSAGFVEIPDKYGNRTKSSESHPIALNRFGMQTIASGSVRFRYSVIKTDTVLAKASATNSALEQAQLKQKKTVDDILHRFRASGTLSQGLSPLASKSLDSSLSSSFDRSGLSKVLGSTGTMSAAKVAELLAKSRAKSAAGGGTAMADEKTSRSFSSDMKRSEESYAPKSHIGKSSIAEAKDEDDSEPLIGGGSVVRGKGSKETSSKSTGGVGHNPNESDDDDSAPLLQNTTGIELGSLNGKDAKAYPKK